MMNVLISKKMNDCFRVVFKIPLEVFVPDRHNIVVNFWVIKLALSNWARIGAGFKT